MMTRAGSYLRFFLGSLLCISINGCSLWASEQVSESLAILAAYQNRPQLTGRAVVKLEIQSQRAGRGEVLIELRGEDAPLTAGHFADLVQRGFYHGLRFHRVEKDPEPFLIYSGDPQSKGSGYQSSSPFQPLSIPLELKLVGERLPRYNETLNITALSTARLALPHTRGAVGMVRSTTLDSASSQFYISLASLPILDGRFAVFGYVLEGMDLIEKLAPEDVILSAQIVGGAEYLVTHP